MARMHSKRHGKAKSRKPLAEELDSAGVEKVNKKEIEEIIVNYAKQGVGPAMIGQKLKNEHNMPYIKHYMGKRLVVILQEKGLNGQMPADLMDLMKKAVNLNAHLDKNKQDKNNMVRLKRMESKIWRLTKYYIRTGALPQGWRYNAEQAKLLIKRSA
jgi:small subunit ribosomal protein S15